MSRRKCTKSVRFSNTIALIINNKLYENKLYETPMVDAIKLRNELPLEREHFFVNASLNDIARQGYRVVFISMLNVAMPRNGVRMVCTSPLRDALPEVVGEEHQQRRKSECKN